MSTKNLAESNYMSLFGRSSEVDVDIKMEYLQKEKGLSSTLKRSPEKWSFNHKSLEFMSSVGKKKCFLKKRKERKETVLLTFGFFNVSDQSIIMLIRIFKIPKRTSVYSFPLRYSFTQSNPKFDLKKDYYHILKIHKKASNPEINDAFSKLAE